MRRILLTTLLLVFAYTLASAQGRGQIKGVVKDAATGEALIGVNVGLVGTSIGSPTDIDGNYIINRVPVGTYMLGASSVGYKKFEIEVTIEAGATLELEINLEQEAVMGEEVVVSAQAQGQREAINQQIQSETIVNVVSETKIQELPDFNAASALGRLPGVSTTKSSGEDNKVVIRGLSPKYNSIEVEGVSLSASGSSNIGFSSDTWTSTSGVSNDRSVDLTSVSPYMIRMIEVYKSLTPDRNANSIGGTVNMELREAPSGAHYEAMWQQGYTAKSNTYGNYRAVLSGSNRFAKDKFGVYALANLESYDRNADNLYAGYGILGSAAEIDSTTGYRPVTVNSVSLNRHVENRNRYGINLIMDYRLPKGSLKLVNMYTKIISDYTDYNQSLGYSNGRMNWRLQQGENDSNQRLHSLKLDYDLGWITAKLSASYTAAGNDLANSPVVNFNQDQGVKVDDERVNKTPDELLDLQSQFRGVDNIILRSGNLFSSFYEEEKFTYKADFEIPYNIGTGFSGAFKFGGQMNHQTNSLNQETPYMAFDGNANGEGDNISNLMQIGLMNEFNLSVNGQGAFVGTDFLSTDNYLFDPFLGNDYGNVVFAPRSGVLVDMINYVIGNPEFDAGNPDISDGRNGGWYNGPYQQLTNDYNFEEDYYATYAMTKFTFGKLFVIGGARYEAVEAHYFAYNAEDIRNAQNQIMFDTTSTSKNEFLLPMGQMKFSATDWMDIRYAYTQTLARPNYNDLSPKYTIPNSSTNLYTGNPDLVPAKAYNHDINVTFHANKLGLLSVGAFYKTIEDFVYTARYRLDLGMEAGIDDRSNYVIAATQELIDRYSAEYPSINSYDIGEEIVGPSTNAVIINKPVNNPYNAIVKGLELDFQHNFWYLPGQLNNFVFGINYARIFSDYEVPFYDIKETYEGRKKIESLVDSSFVGRLVDQPEHVLNTYLGYDFKGFSARFSVLYQSNSARGNGGEYPENDSYTDDYLKLDFTARQTLPWLDGNSQLFMDISNLNGANTQWIQKSTGGFQGIQNYGLTANIGLRIRY